MKNRKQRSIFTIIVLVAVMLIPMAVAIISYYRTAGQPVDVYKAKTLEIADTNGKIYTFSSEKDEEGMIALFSGINNNMTSISSLPEPLRTAPFFKVTFNINGTESVYKYYFSPVSDSYCEDSAGKAYKIKQENAALFVATKYASSLYESANPPLLTTAGGEAVLPGSIFWSFRTSDGTFTDMMGIPTAQAQQSFDMDGSFLLDFDIQPDYVNAKVYNGDNLIFNDLYKNLAGSISITDNTTYKIELEAFWYEDAQRDYRGQATYTVYANVTAPAVFYLGRTKTDRGDVVAISAKNVTDETKIGFTSEPALTFGGKEIVPVFYRTGNVSNALVPIPYDTTVDTYTFTLTYGAITQTMVLEVGAKTFKTGYTSEATQLEVNTFRSEAALKEFADLITSLSSQSAPKMLWNGKFALPLVDFSYNLGFGHSRTITSTKQTYRNEWVDYYSPVKAANVLACGDGIVLYVGAHDYPGNLVVIDHGMGFLTWYMHMADISVSKGDTIKKGSVVGHTGETGFVAAASADLSVMYTINGIPVCPYDLEDNSVVFYLEQ